MNNAERKKIATLRDELVRMKERVEEIGSELRDFADAEQEKFDNMSEGLQGSDRGQAIEQAASDLDSAAQAASGGDLESACDSLESMDDLGDGAAVWNCEKCGKAYTK